MSKPAETAPEIPRDSLSPDAATDVLERLLGRELDLFGTEEKYALSREDVDVLHRFRNRTVFTIGTARSVQVYRTEIVRMVLSVGSTPRLPSPLCLAREDDADGSLRLHISPTSCWR